MQKRYTKTKQKITKSGAEIRFCNDEISCMLYRRRRHEIFFVSLGFIFLKTKVFEHFFLHFVEIDINIEGKENIFFSHKCLVHEM